MIRISSKFIPGAASCIYFSWCPEDSIKFIPVIVIHGIIIRYGESIWPGTSPRQTELNTWIGYLEPDLLAGEGGWVANRSSWRTKWSEWDNACQCFLLYILICISLINPQGWYLQFRWNVNGLLRRRSRGSSHVHANLLVRLSRAGDAWVGRKFLSPLD